MPGSLAEARSSTISPSTWPPEGLEPFRRLGAPRARGAGRRPPSAAPPRRSRPRRPAGAASKVQPSVHSLPPTRASRPILSMGHSCTQRREARLRPRWLPASSLCPMSIARVGIIGSGIMGSGIAEVAAAAGYDVVLRSRSQDSADAMLAVWPASLAKQVEKGKRTQARGRRDRRPGVGHHPPGRAGRRRPGDRVGRRGPGREKGPVRRARQHLQARRHPGHQHLDPARGRDGHGHRPARPRLRHPLLQPGPRHGAGRGGAARSPPPTPPWRRPSSSPPPAARNRSR